MNRDTIILFLILGVVLLFAIYKESKEYKDSYAQSLPDEKDTKSKIYTKIYQCLLVNENSIKWRRCFITAFLATVIMFGLVRCNVPDPRELFLTVLVLYIIYYISWNNYVETICQPVSKIGKNHIKRVRYL